MNNSRPHLLIDADVLAYQCAASVEQATEWEDGYWTWHCDEEEVKRQINSQLSFITDTYDAVGLTLCLTDSEGNFRRNVLPSYKDHRARVKKPLVLKSIKEWLIEDHGGYWRPGLEGDDIMGILSTWRVYSPDHPKVIVSIDKDMKTIPGLFVQKVGDDPVEITEEEADWWHMFQTLTGDVTDGYKGCPGIGPKNAEKLLGEIGFYSLKEMWETVVQAYAKKNLPEEEALIQARVARILRHGEYDMKARLPILWTPPPRITS